MITTIVNTGQTDLEQEALRVAKDLGLEYKGYAEKEWIRLNRDAASKFNLVPPPPLEGYALRPSILWNISDSDLVIILYTKRTEEITKLVSICFKLGRKYIVNPQPLFLASFCLAESIQTIYITGARSIETINSVRPLLTKTLSDYKELEDNQQKKNTGKKKVRSS